MAIFGKAQPMQDMTDAERLAQIMQGNLAGQLNSGDKLSALGALLKSVSRGSTTTPQQVIQGLQQQKLQEVQGRIQLDELKKQAERQAQLNAVRQQYISELSQTNPQLARAVQLMSADDFAKLIVEQNKPQGMGQWSEELKRFIPKDRPVPTRSGKMSDGSTVTEYSNGDKVVTYRDGSQRRFDVEGSPING